jgi:hypothetical protein
VENIADNIFSRDGVLAFARAIGFDASPLDIPFDGDVALEHLGLRGTLRAFLVTTDERSITGTERAARLIRNRLAPELQFFVFVTPEFNQIRFATFAGNDLATLTLERGRIHAADVDALRELIPIEDAVGLQLALQHARALDRVRIGNRFFDDFRGQRALVAGAWSGIAPRFTAEREQLALLLLSRLMFLYFLQRRGFLCGNPRFFVDALRHHFHAPHKVTFYRGVLRPLFFGVLNRRPEKRTKRAAALGDLPYLNGGLFERHHLERRFPDLDLTDEVIRGVFELLLERYRFTASEGAREHAVDPEMLGRVFEGLMAEPARQSTGTFYTPAPVVTRMVRSAFDAHLSQYPAHLSAGILRDVRVLDPACGSGAFLLAALSHIADRRSAVDTACADVLKHDIVARNLHGVDLQHDAALLCALRLWLALIPDEASSRVQPLPNLDRRIRQGDALIDPLDLAAEGAASPAVRAARRALQPLVLHYTTCDPEQRRAVHQRLKRCEHQLSRAWVSALRSRLLHTKRDLRACSEARDLFGEIPAEAREARVQLKDVDARAVELKRIHNKLRENGATPFFSFNVHFADAQRTGFDVILCNPPWVRSHNWPKHLTSAVRSRFQVCRDAGQVDLALVFLERAISLLAPGGTLAIILPAKFLRTSSAGAARELLLKQMEIVSIEDHSLDQRSIFAADAFACIIIARKKSGPTIPNDIGVTMVRRKVAPITFPVRIDRLLFDPASPRSAWLLVPAAVRAAMDRMSGQSVRIGSVFQTRRGVVTGNNGSLIVQRLEGKLGNLAFIKSENEKEAIIEDDVLRPVVRGSGIRAWSADLGEHLIFCHDDHGVYRSPPRRVSRYLHEHTGADARGRIGALQHVGNDVGTCKLAWHDLAGTLKAVVLPAHASCLGTQRPLIPLNTVYYIPASDADAHLLAAYFNSLPFRVFARCVAERAKDSHFRFFACTVALLPLPSHFRQYRADELRDLSRAAHAAGALPRCEQSRLDHLVAAAYGLTNASFHALSRFDRWLNGDDS